MLLQSICVTNDHIYVPFVVITIRYFTNSWHIIFCNKNNTMGATCEAGTAYPSGAPAFTPIFNRVARSSAFCVVFCRSLFVNYSLAIVLSVLRFTASVYPYGIFILFLTVIFKARTDICWWCDKCKSFYASSAATYDTKTRKKTA